MDAETEPEIHEDPSRGPFWVGLWAVARHWVALLEQIYEPDVIAATGITRSFGLRCSRWLWSIEGLVRRLIIAAAAKFDLAQLPDLIPGRRNPVRPHKRAAPSVSFTVLPRIPGRQPHAADTSLRAAKTAEHRHLVFPGDGLLHLFPRRDRRNSRPAYVRTRNPLERRGRISPWDPDYRGSRAGHLTIHARQLKSRESEPRAGRSSPCRRSSSLHGGGIPEWKRIELEWERVIPSHRLAGRIRALMRVIEKPERWVERTARRLAADRGLIDLIRAAPPPTLRKPRLDPGAPPPLQDELAWAHAFPDTS
jgi:hypothetical protein